MSTQPSVHKVISCSECKNSYKGFYDLRKHVKKNHPEKLEAIAPLKVKNYNFKCGQCNKNFNQKKNILYHIKKIHSGPCSSPQGTNNTGKLQKKCALCEYVAMSKGTFYKHYTDVHNIHIESETMEFASSSDFNTWKSKIEMDTKAKFVKERGSKPKVANYICHRSGFYISKSKGKRCIKKQGSNKINAFCPAGLKVVFENDGKHSVSFFKTHVGHQNEIFHLNLTPLERESLAAKLASNIPFNMILDEVRDSVSGSSLERMHLLNKKDLYNIEARFNLQSKSVRLQMNQKDGWVNEVREKFVLFYKPQDVIMEEYPQFKKEDFVVVIMNEAQTTIFKNFSNDCICIDGTYGLKGCKFELHTLLVVDDLGQGFPCAFCISNRSDEITMTLFFECVKKQAGQVQTEVFMSDVSDMYYNAWTKVMSEVRFRLFCTWHVDQAWRKNLHLINLKERQADIYKKLRNLLQETDVSAFERMIISFLNQILDDAETAMFGEYFSDNYVRNATSWALCYRLSCSLNTNMHLERMHKSIKYIYLHGNDVERLDKAVYALMTFIRDKFFDRLVVPHEGKISTKLKELSKRHTASTKLKIGLVSKVGDVWQIPSSSKFSKTYEVYTVSENDVQCCDCQLVCNDCDTCIHKYSCSCLDSIIKYNMCKHIHLLCRYRKLGEITHHLGVNCQQEETDELEFVDNTEIMETEIIFEQINEPSTSKKKSLSEKKEEIARRFQDILNKIETETEFKALAELMNPIEPTLAAVRQGFNPLGNQISISPLTRKLSP